MSIQKNIIMKIDDLAWMLIRKARKFSNFSHFQKSLFTVVVSALVSNTPSEATARLCNHLSQVTTCQLLHIRMRLLEIRQSGRFFFSRNHSTMSTGYHQGKERVLSKRFCVLSWSQQHPGHTSLKVNFPPFFFFLVLYYRYGENLQVFPLHHSSCSISFISHTMVEMRRTLLD